MSDVQGPFITAAKVVKKEPERTRPIRPSSAAKKGTEPLEPIYEEQPLLRCPSPIFRDSQSLKKTEKPEKFEERLEVYLLET